VERDKPTKLESVGQTATVAMETQKGGIPIFLAYLVPLDVVVTGNITAKICEIWSEFKKNLHLGYHGRDLIYFFYSFHQTS
jgi:hypothetical protein